MTTVLFRPVGLHELALIWDKGMRGFPPRLPHQPDLRRGFTGLSALVQTKLEQSPFSGQVFVFRGRRGDLIKVLWYDGDSLCLFAKRLERGRFVWPQATSGKVSLTRAQLSMLLEGIDWRRPERTWQPELSV
jgi:transposase